MQNTIKLLCDMCSIYIDMNRPRTVQKVLPCVTGSNICSGMVGRFANHPFFFNKIVVHKMIVRKKAI